ncbi:cobalamin biosynthesis protein CobW [Pseudoalteromonas sp. MMG013]|uniref:GTP-binding protein n=1 Tax=unclassified Pseudoalteromonas TaxID=194690 RepID=UPI001B395A15|nr:GTP-binding protein [Pseudoalteromonas sp. MMG012]MBQ4852624.1 cobalamin biosynthesis protein CobW [Pseudoalteromonas sp. MMG012]MBQ4863625.1 cobalamin biosynthesis protein CobW [Pseudoalteromonas sp. MMG013]
MEAIVVIVGFLGAGKTTLLKNLIKSALVQNWQPFVILNDYENANLDIDQLSDDIDPKSLKSLSGSCICCSGISQLRDTVNRIPSRPKGITLIEANGTTDACSLMGFLGVGIDARFLPPIQLSVIDVKNWQTRGEHNELEANQIQVSSIIALAHLEQLPLSRVAQVTAEIKAINPSATILPIDTLDLSQLPEVTPIDNDIKKLAHHKAHWASCSTDLPNLPVYSCIKEICTLLPSTILRVKGCTQIANETHFTYFERCPDGEVYVRPYKGSPTTGAKLLTIGPGSEKNVLEDAIKQSLHLVSVEG